MEIWEFSLKFGPVFVIQPLFQLERTRIRCTKRNVTAVIVISRLDRILIFILIIRHPGSGFRYASKFGLPGESAATNPILLLILLLLLLLLLLPKLTI